MRRTDIHPATEAIHALLDRLADSWARGDGAGYGACFTDDASYVTYVGTHYRGAAEIGAAHQALFDSFLKGTRLTVEVVELRFLTDDVAVLVSRGATGKGGRAKPDKVQTWTLVRTTDDRWRVAAFHNTRHQRLMEGISFRLQPATRPAGVRLT
ncbi:SgcJ/EcaC family oxidoreductase [Micromonospora sp. NPDC048930]|uniref:SgcJ/EcaC family oxidoreductase n=1 Tax=Micromonospora sp. NPDC048930 TaxID=3364261 RepID=UPI003722F444